MATKFPCKLEDQSIILVMFKLNNRAETRMDEELQNIRLKVTASLMSVKEREKGSGGILRRQM